MAKEAGVEFSEPSQGLVDLIQEVRAEQEQVWMESALEAGIENPREVMDFFFAEVARLDAEMATE